MALEGIWNWVTENAGDVWDNITDDDYRDIGGLLGLGLGLAGVADFDDRAVGYQGGIPRYTAHRDQVPYDFASESRGPGSLGRRYFSDTVYSTPEGQDNAELPDGVTRPTFSAAQDFVNSQAQGFAEGIAPNTNTGGVPGTPYSPVPGIDLADMSTGDVKSAAETNASNQSDYGSMLDDIMAMIGEQSGSDGDPIVDPATGENAGNEAIARKLAQLDPFWHPRINNFTDLMDQNLFGAQGGPDRATHFWGNRNDFQDAWEVGEFLKTLQGDDRVSFIQDAFNTYGNYGTPQAPSFLQSDQEGEAGQDGPPNEAVYAEGGLAEIGNYLAGNTDGMADMVPTSINGRQPAALSDGEFVIPADVVSHLGNGNSNAGATELENMMKRIRKARTGMEEQGREIDPKSHMPV